jgi:S-phase kinase-associated protein 1
MAEMVKLTTMDGETLEVEKEIACKSVLVRGIVDDSGVDEEIPLPAIKRNILEKIIEYCQYIHKNTPPEIEKPLRSNQLSDVVSEWYANFVNIEQEVLFELILAANFMDIKSLLELACAKVASLIKGMSIPEIRDFFNIENDFTPEEEAQIMDENRWAEESF